MLPPIERDGRSFFAAAPKLCKIQHLFRPQNWLLRESEREAKRLPEKNGQIGFAERRKGKNRFRKSLQARKKGLSHTRARTHTHTHNTILADLLGKKKRVRGYGSSCGLEAGRGRGDREEPFPPGLQRLPHTGTARLRTCTASGHDQTALTRGSWPGRGPQLRDWSQSCGPQPCLWRQQLSGWAGKKATSGRKVRVLTAILLRAFYSSLLAKVA